MNLGENAHNQKYLIKNIFSSGYLKKKSIKIELRVD